MHERLNILLAGDSPWGKAIRKIGEIKPDIRVQIFGNIPRYLDCKKAVGVYANKTNEQLTDFMQYCTQWKIPVVLISNRNVENVSIPVLQTDCPDTDEPIFYAPVFRNHKIFEENALDKAKEAFCSDVSISYANLVFRMVEGINSVRDTIQPGIYK